MKRETTKHAFLILSDCVSDSMLNLYLRIEAATRAFGDTFVVFHNKGSHAKQMLRYLNSYTFNDSILYDLGYTPVTRALVPGSNHFPILKFYLDHPGYDYYWCIEDDIVFNGEWSSFFNQIIKNVTYDFISSYIKHFDENINPDWIWWSSLTNSKLKINESDLVMSFNPVYSLSNRAAKFLDGALKDGWVGHHEVLIATLLNKNNYIVKDFGGRRKFVPAGFSEKFYTDETHLWRPAFFFPQGLLNKIYHPVKCKIKIPKDHQFKISFCVIIPYDQIIVPTTLIKSIEDTLEYKNCEFIIIGCLSCRGLSIIKHEFKDHLEKDRLIFYQTYRPVSNIGLSNLAGKLSNGDILSFLDADSVIGKSHADNINQYFRFRWNSVLFTPSLPVEAPATKKTKRTLSLMKEDFLRLYGFDEQISDIESSQLDFISKVREEGLRIVTNELTDNLHKSDEFAPIQAYLTLNFILIQHIDPATSGLIFIYRNGHFEKGTLINNYTLGHSSFKYSFRKRAFAWKFTRKEPAWERGNWSLGADDETLILKNLNGTENSLIVRDQFYEMPLSNGYAVWQILNEPEEKRRLISFHYKLKNQQMGPKSPRKSKGRCFDLNLEYTILSKNFKHHQPLIVS